MGCSDCSEGSGVVLTIASNRSCFRAFFAQRLWLGFLGKSGTGTVLPIQTRQCVLTLVQGEIWEQGTQGRWQS